MYSDDRLPRPFFLADIFKKTRGLLGGAGHRNGGNRAHEQRQQPRILRVTIVQASNYESSGWRRIYDRDRQQIAVVHQPGSDVMFSRNAAKKVRVVSGSYRSARSSNQIRGSSTIWGH